MEVLLTTREELAEIVGAAVASIVEMPDCGHPNIQTKQVEKDDLIHGVKGLADFLGVSRPTAMKIIKKNKYPCFQQGRIRIFKKDDVLMSLNTSSK